jgi:hypothetical protein
MQSGQSWAEMLNLRLGIMLFTAVAVVSTNIVKPASAATTSKETAWPTGLYSDVSMSRESGDLGGMEIRFYDVDGRHMAEFVMCEGWCNKSYHVELTRDGQGFRFGYGETLEDEDGKVVAGSRFDFIIQPKGRKLQIMLEVMQEGSKVVIDKRLLKRSKQPFGLDVANHMGP